MVTVELRGVGGGDRKGVVSTESDKKGGGGSRKGRGDGRDRRGGEGKGMEVMVEDGGVCEEWGGGRRGGTANTVLLHP